MSDLPAFEDSLSNYCAKSLIVCRHLGLIGGIIDQHVVPDGPSSVANL